MKLCRTLLSLSLALLLLLSLAACGRRPDAPSSVPETAAPEPADPDGTADEVYPLRVGALKGGGPQRPSICGTSTWRAPPMS